MSPTRRYEACMEQHKAASAETQHAQQGFRGAHAVGGVKAELGELFHACMAAGTRTGRVDGSGGHVVVVLQLRRCVLAHQCSSPATGTMRPGSNVGKLINNMCRHCHLGGDIKISHGSAQQLTDGIPSVNC